MNFRKLGMASYKQLAPDPMASLILHRIDIYLFAATFDALMLAKNESSADANTLSGRADKISNFPSMKHPFFSARGFLIWLTRVDFLRQNNQSITYSSEGGECKLLWQSKHKIHGQMMGNLPSTHNYSYIHTSYLTYFYLHT